MVANGKNGPTQLPQAWTEFNREFDRLFRNWMEPVRGNIEGGWMPLSIWEDEKSYHVEVELPGVAQEDLDLSLEDGKLTLTAERKPAEDRKYLLNEVRYGKLQRVLRVPETVDPEAVEAEFKHGILHLSLGKKEIAQPRKIQVKVS